MQIDAIAIVCALRAHGETGAIARLLTREAGMIAGYVAGARGRQLRPVLIPGNKVALEARSRSDLQLPFFRTELIESRGPWLSEPLPAAAIGWATTLAASTLPEQQAYPALYDALEGVLDAVCQAPSARGWLPGMIAYEAVLLRELGYGGTLPDPAQGDLAALLAKFDAQGQRLARYPLADRRTDVMGARTMLRERLARI